MECYIKDNGRIFYRDINNFLFYFYMDRINMTFKEYSIMVFEDGSDNFGEIILGTVGELVYNKTIDGC